MTDHGVRTTPLTADEIIEFSNKGFLRPGRIIDDDKVERMRAALEVAREKESEASREYDLLDPELWPDEDKPPPEPGKSVGFLFNLWMWNDEWRELAFNPTLAQWASQLVGARQIRLLEDNALYKEAGTGGSLKWHQDHPYWPLAQSNSCTAWVALDDVTIENGAMRMAAGSHLTGERLPAAFGTGTAYLQDLRPSTVVEMEDPEELGYEVETIEVEAGEVSFHSSLTWHASGPNVSDRPRRAFIGRYVGDGTIWLGSRRYEYNYADDEVGIEIGDPLGGKYFPLVPFGD